MARGPRTGGRHARRWLIGADQGVPVLTSAPKTGTIPPMSRDTAATQDFGSFGAFFFRGYFGA